MSNTKITKDKGLTFNQAKSVTKNVLAIGILMTISLVFAIITFALIVSNTKIHDAYSIISGLVLEGVGIASFIIIIICWSRWRAIKQHTSVSHLWFTVGYAIALGASLLLAGLIIGLHNRTGLIICSSIDIAMDLFIILMSYILSNKMKKTLHK